MQQYDLTRLFGSLLGGQIINWRHMSVSISPVLSLHPAKVYFIAMHLCIESLYVRCFLLTT
jgi:hypothetical protein